MNKLLILLLILPVTAFATERYKQKKPEQITVENTKGVALGIASANHQFDMGTYRWQGSVAVGGYDSDHAISIGFGKRSCKTCPMVNFSIGSDDDHVGYGAGVNFKF